MLIVREIQKGIENVLFKGKVIVIYGPRQVGKTTLLHQLSEKYKERKLLFLNCDEPDTRLALSDKTSTELKKYVGDADIVFIDEAQRVRDIGLTLKLFIDNFPQIQIVATGSSSFDLSNKISEPLTGRKIEFFLYPFSVRELLQIYSKIEINRLLESWLIYGQYPAAVHASTATVAGTINDLAQSYLYKDIFELEKMKKPELVEKLLQALALQMGQEVAYTELAKLLGADKVTIERYVQMLERAFIIFRLRPFSRNLRNEISTRRKIYFFDLGIRNSLINNFNPLLLRNDVGALWENFCIIERMKKNAYTRRLVNSYFWRTHNQKEVDYLEEYNGHLDGFEFKWSKDNYSVPKDFLSYENSSVKLINKNNYQEFLFD